MPRRDEKGEPNADRPPVIQYWHSERIPAYIAERLATFRERNPGSPHLIFNERTAAELIAERFGERHVRAFRACAVPAMQADYLRYCAVHAFGGVYVDADMTCVNSLQTIFDRDGFLLEYPGGPMLNGLFAFAEPEHPFMAMSVEVATGNIERRASESVALATGPMIFTALVRLHRFGSLEDVLASVETGWRNRVTEGWSDFSASIEKAVAEHGPLDRALAGVRIAEHDEGLEWLRNPEFELPYKSTDSYWANWTGTIFRPHDAGDELERASG